MVLNLNFLFGPEVKVRSGDLKVNLYDTIKLSHYNEKITFVPALVTFLRLENIHKITILF